MDKYKRLIEECNKNREKIIEIDIRKHIVPKNIKGIMVGNKFYSNDEYARLLKTEKMVKIYIKQERK